MPKPELLDELELDELEDDEEDEGVPELEELELEELELELELEPPTGSGSGLPQADKSATELANNVVATRRELRHRRLVDSMVYSVC
ncbi:hypothetical protein DWB84_10770 [Saccharophagus sp. K07]|nr:hypothetical protein [Saccharophagus sp. K07]